MSGDILIGITVLVNLFPVCIFLSLLKKKRRVPTHILLLGSLSILSIINEITLRVLAKYGVRMFSLIDSLLSSWHIWTGNSVKTLGFYVIQNKYIANIFLINIYFVAELSFFICICLALLNVKTIKCALTIALVDIALILTHSRYFLLNNTVVPISLVVTESVLVIAASMTTLIHIIKNNNKSNPSYYADLLYGLIFYAIVDLGYLVYQKAAPHIPFYFTVFFSNVGNILFYSIFRSYKREIK